MAQQYRAMYDFQGSAAENQLSFRAGDIFNILQQHDGGWLTAESNGVIGYVPSNYLTVIAPAAAPTPTQVAPAANPVQPSLPSTQKKVAPQAGKPPAVGRGQGTVKKSVVPEESDKFHPSKVILRKPKEYIGPQLTDLELFSVKKEPNKRRPTEDGKGVLADPLEEGGFIKPKFKEKVPEAESEKPTSAATKQTSAAAATKKAAAASEENESQQYFKRSSSLKAEDTAPLPPELPPPADNRMHPPYAADAPLIPPRTDRGEEGINVLNPDKPDKADKPEKAELIAETSSNPPLKSSTGSLRGPQQRPARLSTKQETTANAPPSSPAPAQVQSSPPVKGPSKSPTSSTVSVPSATGSSGADEDEDRPTFLEDPFNVPKSKNAPRRPVRDGQGDGADTSNNTSASNTIKKPVDVKPKKPEPAAAVAAPSTNVGAPAPARTLSQSIPPLSSSPIVTPASLRSTQPIPVSAQIPLPVPTSAGALPPPIEKEKDRETEEPQAAEEEDSSGGSSDTSVSPRKAGIAGKQAEEENSLAGQGARRPPPRRGGASGGPVMVKSAASPSPPSPSISSGGGMMGRGRGRGASASTRARGRGGAATAGRGTQPDGSGEAPSEEENADTMATGETSGDLGDGTSPGLLRRPPPRRPSGPAQASNVTTNAPIPPSISSTPSNTSVSTTVNTQPALSTSTSSTSSLAPSAGPAKAGSRIGPPVKRRPPPSLSDQLEAEEAPLGIEDEDFLIGQPKDSNSNSATNTSTESSATEEGDTQSDAANNVQPAMQEIQPKVSSPRLSGRKINLSRDDAIKLLRKGDIFLKQEKKGKPHQRFVCLSDDGERIQWRDVQKSKWDSFIALTDILEVRKGHTTNNFTKNSKTAGDVECALSLVCDPKRKGDEKSIDLVASSNDLRDLWSVAVKVILQPQDSDARLYV